MSNETLGTPQTFWSLLKKYDRVEIPIIQRDYAQGRKSASEVREGILKHIFGAVKDGADVELDFIYGIDKKYKTTDDGEVVTFVPIDGQQRLTTLWLIHWYLVNRIGLLKNAESPERDILDKFTYETRPSSKRFLSCLCHKPVSTDTDIRTAIIEESAWFDESWKLDPSIMGAINMLETIENHPVLKILTPQQIWDGLVNNQIVTFYLLSLEKFGLGEEIYTRMNARGKKLTQFENFKSSFFKIIDKSPLKDDIEKDIEYSWVENLWPYRTEGIYVIDEPFMNWLAYITQMLYIKGAMGKDEEDKEAVNYRSIDLLAKVYASEDNLRFLKFSFDTIPTLASIKMNLSLEWDNAKGLGNALSWIIKDKKKTDVMKELCVMAALMFIDKTSSTVGMEEFMRVVRNLIENTNDNSIREWPRILQSIDKLISQDIYSILLDPKLSLEGFRQEQREVERFKARLIQAQPQSKALILSMDDNPALRGRLGNIIIENQEPTPTDIFSIKLSEIDPASVNLTQLRGIFEAYEKMRLYANTHKFNGVWGDFLDTRLYKVSEINCYWDDESSDNYSNYAIHPVILKLARKIASNKGNIDKTLESKQKNFVKTIAKKYNGSLEDVSEPKEQLYLLYIITIHLIKDCGWWNFFTDKRFNFGWIYAQPGYTTPFRVPLSANGMRNMIYQAYDKVFNFRDEIKEIRTPYVLIGRNRGNKVFDRLLDWANSK